jgi:phosphatidate cytidylyltransferase
VSKRDDKEEESTQDPKKQGGRGLEGWLERLELHRSLSEAERLAGNLRGQKARGWTEKLLNRTTSGAIYVIVILTCLCLGKTATALLVAAMAWCCCSELLRMTRMTGRMPNEILSLGAAIVYPIAFRIWGIPAGVYVTLLLLVFIAGWYVITPRACLADVAITVFSPIYTSLAFSCVVLIRNCDPGVEGVLITLATMGTMWANDATAYFVGSRFGRHKMAPRISPHKSWEGLLGGMVGSVLVWIIAAGLHVRGIGFPLAIFTGLVVGVAGVFGDLFESRIKRGVGVKDSGNLMPGHGGMLDRSDSLLFGGMVAYIILHIGGIL